MSRSGTPASRFFGKRDVRCCGRERPSESAGFACRGFFDLCFFFSASAASSAFFFTASWAFTNVSYHFSKHSIIASEPLTRLRIDSLVWRYLLAGSGRDDCAPEKQRRVLELLLLDARGGLRMRVEIDVLEQRSCERHEHVGAARAVREVREHEVQPVQHRKSALLRNLMEF